MAVAGLEFGVLLVRGGLAGRVVGCELGTRGSTGLWRVTVVPCGCSLADQHCQGGSSPIGYCRESAALLVGGGRWHIGSMGNTLEKGCRTKRVLRHNLVTDQKEPWGNTS